MSSRPSTASTSSSAIARVCGVLALAALLAGGGSAVAAPPEVEAARSWRAEHGVEILRDFAALLAVPNVPADPDGLRQTAETIRDRLIHRGAQAELLEHDDAPPIVYGRLEQPGARRTLGIYVHYDGQPVDESRWTQPPFRPTLYSAPVDRGGEPLALPAKGEAIDPEWRLYARGSSDDKAPVPALLAALDALNAAGIQRTSNLVFFFEGEEERGSPHLADFLREHRERLADVDLWLICDGPVHQSRRPQLVFGVRGYTQLEITVYGAERYLHSGHYGNWAPNPAQELARLLTSMKDADGRVLVQGFYDSVTPLGAAEKQAIDRVPPVDDALRRELGLAASEAGNAALVERIQLPSLNIHGMQSATVGPTARNIVPRQATASIDIRLVKGNDPQKMLDLVEQHIRSRGYHIVRRSPDHETRLAHARIARVVRQPGYRAVRTRMDLPLVQPVVAAATAAAGEPVVLMPTLGGSLPLYLFEDLLTTPLVIVPIANHDNNQHAPDENLRIANLWYGIDLFAAILAMPDPASEG